MMQQGPFLCFFIFIKNGLEGGLNMENLMILNGSGTVVDFRVRNHNDKSITTVVVSLYGHDKGSQVICNLTLDGMFSQEDAMYYQNGGVISFAARMIKFDPNTGIVAGKLLTSSRGFGITRLNANVESVYVSKDIKKISNRMDIVSVAINVTSEIKSDITFTTWLNIVCYSEMIRIVKEMKIAKSSLIKVVGVVEVNFKNNKSYLNLVLKHVEFVDRIVVANIESQNSNHEDYTDGMSAAERAYSGHE